MFAACIAPLLRVFGEYRTDRLLAMLDASEGTTLQAELAREWAEEDFINRKNAVFLIDKGDAHTEAHAELVIHGPIPTGPGVEKILDDAFSDTARGDANIARKLRNLLREIVPRRADTKSVVEGAPKPVRAKLIRMKQAISDAVHWDIPVVESLLRFQLAHDIVNAASTVKDIRKVFGPRLDDIELEDGDVELEEIACDVRVVKGNPYHAWVERGGVELYPPPPVAPMPVAEQADVVMGE